MVKSSSSSSSSSSCCEKIVGLKKGPWTPEEDQKLKSYIHRHGHGSWSSLPAKAGLMRCGKSCRLRWMNYLRPDIKRGHFGSQEDQTIIQLHALLGNKWSAIAHHLPKRTDNEIKNYWNTCLKKRLTRMGINPITHKPFNDATSLSHVAQWETARLQAEARQGQQYSDKLQLQNQFGSSSSSRHSLTRLVLHKVTTCPPPPPCLDVLRAWQHSLSSTSAHHQNTPIMHSTYAMMLITDDLESPASTMSFPDTVPLNSKFTNINHSTFGLINQSSLPYCSFSATVASDNGITEGASDGEACGNKHVGSLGDDGDIMVAVEAFRSGGYNHNFVEGLHQKNLGVLSVGDGGIDNFDEERQDWEAILELLDGLPSSTAVYQAPVL